MTICKIRNLSKRGFSSIARDTKTKKLNILRSDLYIKIVFPLQFSRLVADSANDLYLDSFLLRTSPKEKYQPHRKWWGYPFYSAVSLAPQEPSLSISVEKYVTSLRLLQIDRIVSNAPDPVECTPFYGIMSDFSLNRDLSRSVHG